MTRRHKKAPKGTGIPKRGRNVKKSTYRVRQFYQKVKGGFIVGEIAITLDEYKRLVESETRLRVAADYILKNTYPAIEIVGGILGIDRKGEDDD